MAYLMNTQVMTFSAPLDRQLNLRSDVHWPRKLWHMSMGLVIAGVYWFGCPKITGLGILGFFLFFDLILETARLKNPGLNAKIMKLWGPLMRSSEVDRYSGVPYYIASAMLAMAIFPKTIAVMAIVYLACGDPIASWVGIRWGSWGPRFSNGKSLFGALAGVAMCALVGVMALSSLGLESAKYWTLVVAGALSGGFAEMLPLEVDDNFSIPIVSGFVLWFAFIWLGIPPL